MKESQIPGNALPSKKVHLLVFLLLEKKKIKKNGWFIPDT